jgi:hypothetical protein
MKSGTTEYPKNANLQASTTQIRMVDLNLFRVFDAMMRHRSVRKASQMLSVTPSAERQAISRAWRCATSCATTHYTYPRTSGQEGGKDSEKRFREERQPASNHATAFCVALLRCLVNRAAAIT